MTALSRKQREIREREELILDVARRLLLLHGPAGLGMDKIADEVEYSKGTIYQHFRSKEDVLGALAAASMDVRVSLFERAALFVGRPRERMTAIGEAAHLFVRLHPLHFQVEQIVCSTPRDKMEPLRRADIDARERRCFEVVMGILRDGVAQGDLVVPKPKEQLPAIAFGLWSLHVGAHLVMTTDKAIIDGNLADPVQAVRQSAQAMLDGYGWHPLSSGFDYAQTCHRIHREVFGEEQSTSE